MALQVYTKSWLFSFPGEQLLYFAWLLMIPTLVSLASLQLHFDVSVPVPWPVSVHLSPSWWLCPIQAVGFAHAISCVRSPFSLSSGSPFYSSLRTETQWYELLSSFPQCPGCNQYSFLWVSLAHCSLSSWLCWGWNHWMIWVIRRSTINRSQINVAMSSRDIYTPPPQFVCFWYFGDA